MLNRPRMKRVFDDVGARARRHDELRRSWIESAFVWHSNERTALNGWHPQHPVAVLQQGERYTCLSDVGAVVVRADEQVVTTWGAAQHNAFTWQIISDARGGL